MEEYKIGKFTFETKEEYGRALKEYALIKKIYAKYDISDAKIAEVLHGKFKASTIIGERFAEQLEKICRENEVNKIFEEAKKEAETERYSHFSDNNTDEESLSGTKVGCDEIDDNPAYGAKGRNNNS